MLLVLAFRRGADLLPEKRSVETVASRPNFFKLDVERTHTRTHTYRLVSDSFLLVNCTVETWSSWTDCDTELCPNSGQIVR